jgi:hypothetical protein
MAPERRRTDLPDEFLTARQVMDFVATEAVVALDRYERSFAAGDREQPHQSARRLAYWWKMLRMDEVDFGPDPTDAQRILAAAGSIATGDRTSSGLRMRDAFQLARTRARIDDGVTLSTGVDKLRSDFEAVYGGRMPEPDAGVWLKKSLTRLAKASVLAEVLAVPAEVTLSKRVRDTANELVEQGQKLVDSQRRLQRAQSVSIPTRGEALRQQAGLSSLGVLNSVAFDQAHLPWMLEMALKAPGGILVAYETLRLWSDRRSAIQELESAQAALRASRPGVVSTLDTVGEVPPRDVKAVRTARSRGPGPER